MRKFDKELATRVQELMGKAFVERLSYSIPQEGVAINASGTGFAEVIVSTRSERGHEFQVMTAILKFKFTPETTKLKSVVWHTTGESFEYDSDCTSCGSGESLGCQTSFPSVVSLDQGGDSTEQKRPATSGGDGNGDGTGPGMNI